jgi:mannose-6-phosphate isomerase-like protein (cupin superfamily)
MSLRVVERTDKPWGYELLWAQTPQYAGKVLHIRRGGRLSLQYHERKYETILLWSGKMVFVFEDDDGKLQELHLSPGMAHHVPTGRKHRMIALEDCDVFEVSTNDLDDVVRLEDSYGRADQAAAH